MAPKVKFTKEQIISAALDIAKENGISGVTARSLAFALNSSPKPIFGLFDSMVEVQQAVMVAADSLYQSYIAEEISKGEYPPYKASGIAYIRFASQEKELFKLLFMRNRSSEIVNDGRKELRPILDIIKNNLGISEDEAFALHLKLWVYVHGIATMIATDYLKWDIEFISSSLTDVYTGLKSRYTER